VNGDRLVTIWILVICTIFGVSLSVAVLLYGPRTGLTVAVGLLGAKLIARLRP
jgi:hypothetical protein